MTQNLIEGKVSLTALVHSLFQCLMSMVDVASLAPSMSRDK